MFCLSLNVKFTLIIKGTLFIEISATKGKHFTVCNNVKCGNLFLVDPAENPGDLGYLCPECSRKTLTHHVIQCSSCTTVLNLVRASDAEQKIVFNVGKCSHCYGSLEDEWEIEPLYQSDSYI